MRRLLPLLVLAACYRVPVDLPPYDGVPITESNTCAPSRVETVDCVLDGDTFDITRCGDDVLGERFRMLGIDAPEVAHEGNPAECFAQEATDALEDRILGKDVLLEFDITCEGAFGRTLAWVFLVDPESEEEENLNVWMVESGLVRLYEEFDFDKLRYVNELQAAADAASAGNVGLWGACSDE